MWGALLLVETALAHSWLDCVDYDCPAAAPGAGPQEPAGCTCRGYPRNWANVMAGAPFAADRGRDNRPGAAPTAGGLFCDPGKEPDPGAGTGIPANLYSAQYPAATLAKGQSVRWRWPAKNHANTPAAGTVEVYISDTPNTGDTFSTASPIKAQFSYSSEGGDCLGLAQSTDTADCQATWEVPTDLQEGRYTIMWWWEFNAGEFYNSCADVMITAATDGGGNGGGGGGNDGGGDGGDAAASPPPPPDGSTELSVVHVSLTATGDVSDFDSSKQAQIAQAFADESGVAVGNVEVFVEEGYGVAADGDGVVTITIYIKTESADEARSVMNVLGSDLATAATASQLLAGAGVEVVSVQLVEATTPAQAEAASGGGGGGGGGGGSGATVALLVLLALCGVGVGLYCLKQRSTKQAGAAATLTISTKGSVPPPPQVGLPAGWTAAADPNSGQTYYISPKGEAQWTFPTGV